MASALVRGMATSAADSVIKHVTIIGGGLMGSGIAQVSGHNWLICTAPKSIVHSTYWLFPLTFRLQRPLDTM